MGLPVVALVQKFIGVSPVSAPVTRRSASFRLRFHFVRVVRAMRAVRAGEEKLHWRMLFLSFGPPGANILVRRRLFACLLCTGALVLRGFLFFISYEGVLSFKKCGFYRLHLVGTGAAVWGGTMYKLCECQQKRHVNALVTLANTSRNEM